MDCGLITLKTSDIHTLLEKLNEYVKRIREGHDRKLPVITIHCSDGRSITGSVIHYGRNGGLVLSTEAAKGSNNCRLVYLEDSTVNGIEINWDRQEIDRVLNNKDTTNPMAKLTRDDLNRMVDTLQSELQNRYQQPINIVLDSSLLKAQKKANFAGIIAKDTVKVLKDMASEEPARQAIGDSIDTILLRIDQEPSLKLEDKTFTVTSTCNENWFRRKSMKQMKGYLESVL